MSNVLDMAKHMERRENSYWDNQARRFGFADFASLSEAEQASFDEAWDQQAQRCTHPDKLPQLGMCENCAQAVQW